MKLKRVLVAAGTVVLGRRRRRRETAERAAEEPAATGRTADQRTATERTADGSETRIAAAAGSDRRSELGVAALLLLAALFAAGFIVSYAELHPTKLLNLLLGVCIAGALASIAAALVVVSRRLVVTEELEEDYPRDNPREQREIAQLVRDSGSRFTRRKLLVGAAATAGGAVGLAGLTPVLSLGPLWDTAPLRDSPWYRGRRLVDAAGRPMLAADIEEETFYSAFPERADPEAIASPLVVVRLEPTALRLPAGRRRWAPSGILAYSRICTHAGCAIELYTKPRFAPVEPKPALVCPCHYSTFDPATGATVIFGPAGRPLPQLPLMIDTSGHLAAAADFSGRVGPAWWGVRERPS